METKKEIEKRWLECEKLISKVKGTCIDQNQAKTIYKLLQGGFRFTEIRLDNTTTIVIIKRQYDNLNMGEESIFLIKGHIGEKLNME